MLIVEAGGLARRDGPGSCPDGADGDTVEVTETSSDSVSSAGSASSVGSSTASTPAPSANELFLPDYDGACISNLVPALLDDIDHLPAWMPAVVEGADQVVLLVLDGLGWDQFQARQTIAGCLASMDGSAITSVAPTTTATALTSIATGTPPGEHGVVGYRIAIGRDVLNCLRWTTPRGDARHGIKPTSIGLCEPFESQRPPIVVRAEFEHSGFSEAHLRNTRFVGYRTMSTLAIEVANLLRAGEPFVYAYYDGIDKVAHEYGLGEHYDAELIAIDWMVEYLVEVLPPGAVLVVTADHGQVDVGERMVRPHPEVMSTVDFQSGEARFRWLHAVPGGAGELLDAARRHHAHEAWVVSRDEVVDGGWFGPKVVESAWERLGDVALVARDDIAFDDPADTGPYDLIARHGSMTSAEVLVPLVAARR